MTIVTRFAPSPTGYLHIGSARTALFNYLFTRHYKGKFRLRVEDTDRERSTDQATQAIFDGLKWLGIDFDDEVIFQSKRNDLYKAAAEKLLDNGGAYYCFSSQQEIDNLRSKATENKEHFIFKSPWRDADPVTYPKNIQPVIRLRAPRTGQTIIHDELQGNIVVENDHIDDMVLLRSNGVATYMLAVVVDDHDMGITHIIRGDDHLTNAARQIAIYNAFGWKVPVMVHIPLIHGGDGAKLSKRHGALGVEAYRDMGYLPEALNNYLLRLGWSHGDEEIIPRDKAIELFDISALGKSPARLDFAKMNFLNAHYLRQIPDDKLAKMIFEKLGDISEQDKLNILSGIACIKPRAELVTDAANLAKIFIISKELEISDEAKDIIMGSDKNLVKEAANSLEKIEDFNKDRIQETLKSLSQQRGVKIGDLMKPLRALITGMVNSPSVFEVIEIIGKEVTMHRLTNRNNSHPELDSGSGPL